MFGHMSRRSVLRGTVALGAFAMTDAMAAPAARLPARGNVVIRNAFVMTMERDTGDIAGGDVHVRVRPSNFDLVQIADALHNRVSCPAEFGFAFVELTKFINRLAHLP